MPHSKTILSDKSISLVKEGNNFNFIRLFLAFSVMFVHFSTLTDSYKFWDFDVEFFVRCFFTISGFLVMFSYIQNPNVFVFSKKRLRRILPAYLFVVVLFAILGVFISSFGAREYFLSSHFWSYLCSNIGTLNFITPNLPGVFESNYHTAVNGSLWTIKVELMMYMIVPLLFFLFKRYNALLVLGIIYVASILHIEYFEHLYQASNSGAYRIIKRQFPGQLAFFVSGIIVLLYFEFFLKNIKYIFPLSVLILLFRDCPIVSYFEPIAMASVIVSIAYNFKWLGFFRKYNDISYGIYLFHYPVIQMLANSGMHKTDITLTFILSVLICVSLGIFSWKYIEKPLLYKSSKKTART